MPEKANAIEAGYEAYLAGYDAAVYEESGGVGLYNSGLSGAIVYVKRSFADFAFSNKS